MRHNILMRRLDPWKEMMDIQREMNRLFNHSFDAEGKGFPAINLWANNEEAVVKAEVPGMDQKDIHLNLANDILIIQGEIPAVKRRENESVHRKERHEGPFKREINLPFGVNPEKVKASLKNGILTISLPRAEADKPRQISIS